jgi:NarL family two-component system response regulator LiaR
MSINAAVRSPYAEKPFQRPVGAAQHAVPAIRVFAIDAQPLCRRGMAAMLASEGHCLWTGEAATVAEAAQLVAAQNPDVLLIEHRMPDIDGVAAMKQLQHLCPKSRFVLVTAGVQASEVRRAMDAGAACVLHKSIAATDLVLAVRAVHGGQRVLPPVMMAALDREDREALSRSELTPRELGLLELMAQGLDNRAIADLMHITVPTVKFHITNIMSKLHASNRTAAVLAALRQRLVSLEPRKMAARTS